MAALILVAGFVVFVEDSDKVTDVPQNTFAQGTKSTQRFLIAPKLDSLNCDDNGFTKRHEPCDDLLRSFLNGVEPGGARGEIQFGYTLTIPIFEIFHKVNKAWAINEKRVKMYLDLIKSVNRPVVVHIGANHFSPDFPIVREIMRTPENRMEYIRSRLFV